MKANRFSVNVAQLEEYYLEICMGETRLKQGWPSREGELLLMSLLFHGQGILQSRYLGSLE